VTYLPIDLTVILGFEHESYNISEGIGSVKVCVQVKDGVPRRLLRLSLVTLDGTATGNNLCMHIPTCSQSNILLTSGVASH